LIAEEVKRQYGDGMPVCLDGVSLQKLRDAIFAGGTDGLAAVTSELKHAIKETFEDVAASLKHLTGEQHRELSNINGWFVEMKEQMGRSVKAMGEKIDQRFAGAQEGLRQASVETLTAIIAEEVSALELKQLIGQEIRKAVAEALAEVLQRKAG
jgi:hypothetical protein